MGTESVNPEFAAFYSILGVLHLFRSFYPASKLNMGVSALRKDLAKLRNGSNNSLQFTSLLLKGQGSKNIVTPLSQDGSKWLQVVMLAPRQSPHWAGQYEALCSSDHAGRDTSNEVVQFETVLWGVLGSSELLLPFWQRDKAVKWCVLSEYPNKI